MRNASLWLSRARPLWIAGGLCLLGLALVAFDRCFPPDLHRYRTHSLQLLDRRGTAVEMLIASDGIWRLPAPPEDASKTYLDLLLEREDRRFWLHPGVDPLALVRAAFQLATSGHIVSGGSTLTMQVARLLAPHRHSFKGKLLDIVRAVQLEAHFSKPEILAMYLTLAPMGGNIEGVQAASALYFRRPAATLSPLEAAELVALPRQPTHLRPDRYPEALHAAAASILADAGMDRPNRDSLTAPIPRYPPPHAAPHLAERLAGTGADGTVATTLDASLQNAAAALARQQHGFMDSAANLALIVVDNHDRSVLAYVGGADYLGPGGMVDVISAVRSPGSTLKPFIYALAFDDTLVRPETVIDDEAIDIDGYAPRNFDRIFHGAVTVTEALQQSYNLPAVQVLRALGPPRFAATLRQAGARLVLPAATAEAALPIALGGVGIDLEDLAALYVGLADGGEFAPLRLSPAAPASPPQRLLTRAAAWQIGKILRGTPTPDGVSPARDRPIAYKTGTSYGFHDAWALGYSPSYTVGVWVGRTDGSARPGAFGREAAAPVLFQLFDLLPQETIPEPADPGGLEPGTARLAPGLQHFRQAGATSAAHERPGPRILFPPAGATLDALDPGHPRGTPVSLEAQGGRPPYRWLVDGIPLPLGKTGRASWTPVGAGFARISVIDGSNEAVSETVRVR
jgi:penicillin-binding protein 1C